MKRQKPGVKDELLPSNASRERFARIYHLLRTRICLLDYPPGTRLSEEALAAEFGISRTPLRRVLGWLESQGLLRSVHGVGTIVTDVDIEAFGQVYQLRMELAELIGKLSPVAPTAETISLFRTLEARSRALVAAPDARDFAQLNIDFFHALMRLSDNEPLKEISERLYYQTARIWQKSISRMDLAEEVTMFGREITEVRAAVEIGDVSAAAYIRRSHISMSFVRLSATKGKTGI
ncbi:GntR family transcriptional regulator [Rhizobium halophytocola]|uniref:DNA-binding GntR family transcriptional regulator n=1 Tax=Rhizobium halophytocola TaxID=735519 RepID=A0ABS4DUX0_9HYPH|nr:GntR family transcriptional regulator [Rhizobium halophytocola]MBP1849492.1 DNA-binding GntR family transcriptional regulator [Rhizobium halophytocola]